ncbi:hypothetical protein BOW53_16235, partial [Solemya pervernicosa gill symbiont]
MLRTRVFREKIAGLSDLLNWAALIDDGIIIQKDGSFMAGFYYRGNDIDSSTPLERNVLRARVNSVLSRLGSGWMLHIDALRLSSTNYPDASKSHFPDDITQTIDEERRFQYQNEDSHYESIYVLMVTFLPPLRAKSRLSAMMLNDGGSSNNKVKYEGVQVLNQFKTGLVEIEEGLSGVIRLRRLSS